MYQLTLTEPEFRALVGLVDAGVRATGLNHVTEAAALRAKFENPTVIKAGSEEEKTDV